MRAEDVADDVLKVPVVARNSPHKSWATARSGHVVVGTRRSRCPARRCRAAWPARCSAAGKVMGSAPGESFETGPLRGRGARLQDQQAAVRRSRFITSLRDER